MSTLTINRTYLDGDDLTETQLDNANDSIETWANGNIGSTNIATGGVDTTNLASNAVTTAKIDTSAVTITKIDATVISTITPPGVVLAYAAASAPTGFLLCDGSAVSRSTYSALFAIIGITHGQGNATTTFNIPDYRGRFLRGVDSSQARDPNAGTRTAMATGGNTGDNVGSIQATATKLPTNAFTSDTGGAHTHTFATARADLSVSGSSTAWNTPNSGGGTTASGGSHSHSITGGGDSESRPINAGVWYIIKT